METIRILLLVPILMHFGCAPNIRARDPSGSDLGQASSGAPSPVPPGSEVEPPSAPTKLAPQAVVNLKVNSVPSGSTMQEFRLRERAQIWLVAPGCSAAGIVPTLQQGKTEVAKIGDPNTLELPSGVYQLTFSMLGGEVDKSVGGCTAFFQVLYMADRFCTADVVRFGILPFDLEAPVVESIGDLNADGRADYKVVFSASPSQVATRLAVHQESPECVRTVFDGLGHVVALNGSKDGWRRFYFLDFQYLGSAAPEWLVAKHGARWSITWSLDYDSSSQSYHKSSTPVRCEQADGVQRALGDSGFNAPASLIPQALCQPKYWE